MVLNDRQIQALCESSETPMITPYLYRQCRAHVVVDNPLQLSSQTKPVISYGQSSFGYDIRLADTGLNRFLNPQTDFPYPPGSALARIIDPKEFDVKSCLLHQSVERDHTGAFYTIPPRAYALGVSVETFHIPVNTFGICYCKSTYARCGLMVNTTPLEPGWRGQLVLELANLTDLPMIVYANEGIAQVVFFTGDVPAVTYADRDGKYQDQRGIVTARV